MLLALLLLAVPDYELPAQYEVVVCMATECPLAKLYANRLNKLATRFPQVHFKGLAVQKQDDDDKLAEFGKKLGFTFRRDPGLVASLGATRSPEVFLLVDGKIVYQGRIDDQYCPGANRAQPTRHDLKQAIIETLVGQPVSVPQTEPAGCRISVPAPQSGEITFQHVSPIFHNRCAGCHRPGEVAPFSLLTYNDALSWKEMIHEVVSNGRMPPWHADPQHGHFANDRSLLPREKSTLLRWLNSGAPSGKNHPAAPTFREGWSIEPDLVLQVEQPFTIPAEGVLDYQEFVLDPRLNADTWVQAVEIQPGNKAVVHHINAYLRPKHAAPGSYYVNEMGDGYLAMAVPGNTVTSWPPGIAKLIPAGFQIVLSVHYQPNGTQQQDRSRIAFQLADARTVRQQAATRVFLKEDLVITANSIVTAEQCWTTENDYTLYALYPHMHLRGQSMRFEIEHPHEVLLNVPVFDFNWQHRYVLKKPLALPAGTVIRCTAVYDNTSGNPNNPDPNATVRHGRQSTDEMFQSCFEVVLTNENRLESPSRPLATILGLAVVALLGLFFCKRGGHRQT